MVELARRPDSLLRRLRGPGRLCIELQGARLTFESPEDFDFALAPRSTLPLDKLLALVEQPDELLEKQAVGAKLLSSRLWEVHAGAADGCRVFLRQYGIQAITKDQDWRGIFSALLVAEDLFDAYLRVATARFIDYLDSRHAAIRLILRQRHMPAEAHEPARLQRTFAPTALRRRTAINFSA